MKTHCLQTALLRSSCFVLALLSSTSVLAVDEELAFKSFDKFVLNAKVSKEKGLEDKAVKKVIIITHGSGPIDMDGTFVAATKDKKGVFLYKRLAHALSRDSCVVIRYHKRGYEWRQKLIKDRKLLQSKEFKESQRAPLSDLIKDVEAFAKYAQKRFPSAAICLLGHSQGTFVALQAAHRNKFIKGVGAIGFMSTSLGTLSFEQLVYRSMRSIRPLDKDGDAALSMKELEDKDPISLAIKRQFPYLDLNSDKKLSFDEIRAASFTNFLNVMSQDIVRKLIEEELKYPDITKILAKCSFKVGFFQGQWDNQTPMYQVKAIEFLNKWKWANKNLKFWYFPKLGHDLGLRKDYTDLSYRPIDEKALSAIGEGFKDFFKFE
jgi:pimeloyl-ACP methyl ester carboxylesterase